jgi:ubiquitin-protein ligase
MALSFKDILNNGVFNAVTSVYQDDVNARTVLYSIGFPSSRLPAFTNAQDFWARVCEDLEAGVLVNGFDLLVRAAARAYPGNPSFLPFQPTSDQIRHPGRETASVVVSNWNDPLAIIAAAREIAGKLGHTPQSVGLGFSNAEGILLDLVDWHDDEAMQFRQALEAAALAAGHRAGVSYYTNEYRDYLISRLFVEGPDQARFEIQDVSASTKIREIAQGVIASQYDPKIFGHSPGERGRRTVVDRVASNGSHERLDPDKTLHDHGIREGETLSVSPESRAGISPVVREDALIRARNQLLAYAESHPDLEISANSQQAPTDYLLKFHAPGFAPPTGPEREPLEIDEHTVYVMLPADFPMVAPEVFWQTPIFHPNVHPKIGKVCLGPLEEHYRPGMDFGDLCQFIIDIGCYRSYVTEEGYNIDAQIWALSAEGQAAIERRGGRSVTRRILEDWQTTSRPLRIKPLTQ